MQQPDPIPQALILALPASQRKNISQRPNLQLVEILIDCVFHERLELEHALLDFEGRLWIRILAVFVRGGRALLRGVQVREAEECWVRGCEAGFEGVGAAVEDFVDGVDDVVDEGL